MFKESTDRREAESIPLAVYMLLCHIFALLISSLSCKAITKHKDSSDAVLLNCLLFYASFKSVSHIMGSYRFYMRACILLNVIFSFIYTTTLPVIQKIMATKKYFQTLTQSKYSFAVAAAGPFRNQHYVSQMCFLNCPTALILCSCFLYRYKILCRHCLLFISKTFPYRNDSRLVKGAIVLMQMVTYLTAIGIFQCVIYVCLQPTEEITQSLGTLTADFWKLKLNETGYVGGILQAGQVHCPFMGRLAEISRR